MFPDYSTATRSLNSGLRGVRTTRLRVRENAALALRPADRVTILFMLAAPAMSAELFRYRCAARDGGTLDKGPLRKLYFVIVLPNGTLVEPRVEQESVKPSTDRSLNTNISVVVPSVTAAPILTVSTKQPATGALIFQTP